MKLISEEIQDAEYLVEDAGNGKKNYKIRGIFLQSDVKNRNGRIYESEYDGETNYEEEHCT